DILRHVLGVGVLQLPLAAPAVDVPPVALDEFVPGGLVRRVLRQPPQQGDARRRQRGVGHGYYPPKGLNLAPIISGGTTEASGGSVRDTLARCAGGRSTRRPCCPTPTGPTRPR